ncbi:MAG: amidohydrolase family protein [Burkholderiales bacterium]
MWLSENERKDITTHDELDLGCPSPVPTQIVSNGEYNPPPQTEKQKQVESRLAELADQYASKLNMTRRQFLKTSSGMATAFLAMNQVFGPVWDVSEAEAADIDLANERAKGLKKQFIFDDQTHFVRDDFDKEGLLGLGKYAAEHWNPSMLNDMPLVLQRYKFQNYLKEMYLDSDTKVALLSSAPFDDPDWWLLNNDQIVAAREAINKVAGSRRMFAHTVITPGQGDWMNDQVERGIAEFKPDSWKCYTIGDPLAPSTRNTAWRLDDEKLVYPWYERAMQSGIQTICIHKGLLPRDYEQSWPGVWQHATVDDVIKAAKDWPKLNFIIYHGALRMFLEDPQHTLDKFERTGRIDWTTDVCELATKHGLTNVYAELGTTFATVAVASPRLAGAMVGQFVNEMGADHVVWGTDSVWYGSPQWQIEAMRRLEVPDDIMKKMGWKTKLGGPDSRIKRMIFGQNSAKLYGYRIRAEYDDLTHDQIAQMKNIYESEGIERNNVAYGYVHKRSA